MSAVTNRLQTLAATVNAWSTGPDRASLTPIDAGVMQRLTQGTPRLVDYEAIKAAHERAQAQVPMFMAYDVVDVVTPSLVGYASDLRLLREATANALGIKEKPFPRVSAFWAGVRSALTGA